MKNYELRRIVKVISQKNYHLIPFSVKYKLNNLQVIYFIPKEFQKDFKLLNLFVPDTTGFFVKHVQTGMCINDTSIIHSKGSSWGNMSFLQLSNNCLDPAAQFRFVNTSAMLNLKRPGCLHPLPVRNPTWLALWVASVSQIELGHSCYQELDITQTSWGGLSTKSSRCAEPKTDQRFANRGINSYIGLNQDCNDNQNRRFNFGKILVSSHTLPFYDIKQKLYTVHEIKCSLMNKKKLCIAQNVKH